MDEIVKRCRCGLGYTLREWRGLKFVGEQTGLSYTLELRLCLCGSSISRRVA